MNSEMRRSQFEQAWERVKVITGWADQKDLAAFVGSSSQSVSGVKKRGKFPVEWARRIGKHFGAFTDYIMDGEGPARKTGYTVPADQIREGGYRLSVREEAPPDYAEPDLDSAIEEIVQMLQFEVPEAKPYVLKLLHGKKEMKEALQGLGVNQDDDF